MRRALIVTVGLVAAAFFVLLLLRGRGGVAPTSAAPGEEPSPTVEPSPARLRPPLLPLPEPDAESTRRPALPLGVVGALTFEPEELPAGLVLAEPGWLFRSNPVVVSAREDRSEVLAEAFGSALDPDDVRRIAFWVYEGETELAVYALEFRRPGLVAIAARAFTPDDEDAVFEFVEGERVLALVGGERRDAMFHQLVELVEGRID